MILIFDLGRTHKKVLIFDREYKVVEEDAVEIPDIKDEDGDPCEDIISIGKWMKRELKKMLGNTSYSIQGINFSAHGASFVHLDKKGDPATAQYDYMKHLPADVTDAFYDQFGGRKAFSISTASPALDLLNSGMQLFWLKQFKPKVFEKIDTSLHLPQYGNFIFSGKKHADITSIGCHTGLWDFKENKYHPWLENRQVRHLLPDPEAVTAYDQVRFGDEEIPVGIGLHDSSSALYPFVKTAEEPFILLSTGTWNIALNPYFESQLAPEKYNRDCLFYLLGLNRKVAASRIFLGKEYEFQARRLEQYFNKEKGFAHTVVADEQILKDLMEEIGSQLIFYPEAMKGTGPFPLLKGPQPDLPRFRSFEEAYHRMVLDMTYLQVQSIKLIANGIKRLYISGGFLKNEVFMNILQSFLPDWQIFEAKNKRSSALGAAIALHEVWQSGPLPSAVSPVRLFQKKIHSDLSHLTMNL